MTSVAIRFQQVCFGALTEARCNELLARVHRGMNRAMEELSEYRSTHPAFEVVGEKMAAAWAAGLARSIVPE